MNFKKIIHSKSLFTSTFLYGTLIAIGILVINITIFTQLQVNTLKKSLINKYTHMAEIASISAYAGYLIQVWPFETLREIKKSEDVVFWHIITPSGKIELSSNPAKWGSIIKDEYIHIKKTLIVDSVYKNEKIKVIINPIKILEDGKYWSFRLGISLKSIKTARMRLILNNLISIAFILSLIYFSFLFIINRIKIPILKLMKGMKEVAKGNLNYNLGMKREDEIGVLVKFFNQMTKRLKKLWQKTQKQNIELLNSNKELSKKEAALKKVTKELEKYSSHLEKLVDEKMNALKKANTQLIQSEKMAGIGQLAAGVAHEVNNPTGFIITNLQVLQRYVNDLFDVFIQIEKNALIVFQEAKIDQKRLKRRLLNVKKELNFKYIKKDIPELINETLDGALRIKKIVAGLKDFAHPNQDICQITDVNHEVERALSLVNNEIKYNCEIKKDFQKIPRTLCHPIQLSQVLINLFINASQAIDKKRGLITIKTYIKDSYICIEISDNGKGIPKKSLEEIFNPFFTTKEVGKGTGLGLSIVYGIIENMNGKIEVKSKVKKGTTFTIKIPIKCNVE